MIHPAVTFLQFMHPHDLWLINAFPVDRASSEHKQGARTFQAGEEDALVAFLAQYEGGSHNVYFSVNPPRGRMGKKALRTDIDRMTFLHVDLDPRVGEDTEMERSRILGLLTTNLPDGVPKPTAVVDSGGGYWGFWRLDEGYPIEGSETRYEEAKLFNLQLELLFGADACHNVDRIARMPGTVNYPDAKKIGKGRTAQPSVVVELNDVSYPLDSFTKAPQVQAPSSAGFSTGHTVEISENVQRIMDLDRELPTSVPSWCKVVIAKGCDPDDPSRFAKGGVGEIDRSDALFYTVCELVRHQVADDVIYAIITDPDWEISESVLDGSNGRGTRYARRQIERAHEFAVDPMLADMNNQYAVVQDAGAGRCRVIYENEDTGVLVYQSPGDFKLFYSNQFVEIPTQNGARQVPVGKWWFEHKMRRSYRGIVFLPGEEVGRDVYNLWRGFAFEAVPGGSCDLWLDHVRRVICNGEERVYEYLLNWMARAVQKPNEQGHTAIVLRGSQGAGKGTLAKTFIRLFGHHGKQITNPKHLVGNFNAHLRDCVALFADEAIAAASNEQAAILKTLVTEDSMMVEKKGIDATDERSFLHVMMASNSEWVVPAGPDDRRFVMLDVDDSHVADASYWGAINAELRNGGYEAILYFLMSRDIREFDPRVKPTTAALQEQKHLSFDPITKWWYGVLQDGQVGEVSLIGETLYPSSTLTYEFNVTQNKGHQVSTFAMRKFLARATQGSAKIRQATQAEADQGKIAADQRHTHSGEVRETIRPNIYDLPTLVQLRAQFDATHGGPYDWPEPSPIEITEEPF